MINKFLKFNESIDDKISLLVDLGKTTKEIAEEIGISKTSVIRRLKNLNIKTKSSIEREEKPMISKEELEKYIDLKLSIREIARRTGKSFSSIRYWFDQYQLDKRYPSITTKGKIDNPFEKMCNKCNRLLKISEFYKKKSNTNNIRYYSYCKNCINSPKNIKDIKYRSDINWELIQKDFESGEFTAQDIMKNYNLSRYVIKDHLDLKILDKSKWNLKKNNHTEESKLKISNRRKIWLTNNPDKHPWKNKGKNISHPYEHFKKFLQERGIDFQEEVSVSTERFFSVDILIPEFSTIIEINGNQM